MGKNIKWTKEMIIEAAAAFSTRGEFYTKNPKAYHFAQRHNLLNESCSHMEAKCIKWTKETILKEAAQYKKRYEFQTKSQAAYSFALTHNWLDEACSHMEYTKRTPWTKKMILKEASQYKTRGEFQTKSPAAYRAAQSHDWLIEACDHMGPGLCGDNNTIYLWRAIGQYFNSEPIYKIGITSKRLGTHRIEFVAKEHGFKYEIIAIMETAGKATKIEKKLLGLGESPKLTGSGSTEFRSLNTQELKIALFIIKTAA